MNSSVYGFLFSTGHMGSRGSGFGACNFSAHKTGLGYVVNSEEFTHCAL